jgi:glycolate oxidase FAD binding subunit
VKNVAGYDFCKLLTGSLGTLGIITQVTLKLKPIPEQQTLLACPVRDSDEAERVLAALVRSETTPTAVELLAGPVWQGHPALATLGRQSAAYKYIVVALEGTATEVEWMTSRLGSEWRDLGVEASLTVGDSADLWRLLVEFPAEGEFPLVLKASLLPSGVTTFLAAARELDPQCSVQAHAGNGIVIVKFPSFPEKGLSRALVGGLLPVATRFQGNVVVLSNPSGSEMTHQSAWGGIEAPFALMSAVKRQFDPQNVLNRGRFVYI